MLGLYVDNNSSAVGHICVIQQAVSQGAYATNVKCISTSVPDHIVGCSGFI